MKVTNVPEFSPKGSSMAVISQEDILTLASSSPKVAVKAFNSLPSFADKIETLEALAKKGFKDALPFIKQVFESLGSDWERASVVFNLLQNADSKVSDLVSKLITEADAYPDLCQNLGEQLLGKTRGGTKKRQVDISATDVLRVLSEHPNPDIKALVERKMLAGLPLVTVSALHAIPRENSFVPSGFYVTSAVQQLSVDDKQEAISLFKKLDRKEQMAVLMQLFKNNNIEAVSTVLTSTNHDSQVELCSAFINALVANHTVEVEKINASYEEKLRSVQKDSELRRRADESSYRERIRDFENHYVKRVEMDPLS